ncbi:MAG: magnesium transporter CorA family protein [Deltaproteobacteria bacterium]|nr:magnesium transporter CorA family protein [Deltaproteobacteria bacterium]
MLVKYQLADGRAQAADNGLLWVFSNPDEAERRNLVNTYGIDEHTLNSALDPDELARVEYEPEHIAIICKRPKSYSHTDDFLFKVLSSGMFLFKDKLIVVISEEAPLIEGIRMPFKGSGSPIEAMLRILYRTIYHFLEHLRVITMMSDSLERRISESFDNRHLLNLFKLQKSLVYYVSAISSNTVAIEKLKNAAQRLGFTPEQQEFIDDIAIENQQCYRQAEISSNILASLMDARVSIVNNNLSVLMKTLNIITLSIMVPTFVVSAFSMNVKIPLQEYPWAFWAIMGLGIVSTIGFQLWGKFKLW